MNEYKNNSTKAFIEDSKDKEKPKMEKIVTTEPKIGKGLKGKLTETFTHEDKDSILEYICMDVVVPMLKEAALSAVNGALSMMFYGDPSRGYDGRTKYSTISSSKKWTKEDRRETRTDRMDVNEVIFSSRMEAIKVLNALKDRIDRYDCCTVADFYEAIGSTPSHSDYKYGWLNLDSVYISENRRGYTIEFTKPRYLD